MIRIVTCFVSNISDRLFEIAKVKASVQIPKEEAAPKVASVFSGQRYQPGVLACRARQNRRIVLQRTTATESGGRPSLCACRLSIAAALGVIGAIAVSGAVPAAAVQVATVRGIKDRVATFFPFSSTLK